MILIQSATLISNSMIKFKLKREKNVKVDLIGKAAYIIC